MPQPTKGPRLGGSPAHQRLILANLATQLFEHQRITTTEAKARRLRPYAERLITKAKVGDLHNIRQIAKLIRDKDVIYKLVHEIGPFFADREGGYTRITKTLPRKGDNAPMAVIELVSQKTVTSEADRARRVSASQKAAPAPEAEEAPVVDETPEIADKDRVRMAPIDVMRMCFTSGTTGNPKGVLHCFNTTLTTCETFNRELGVTKREVMLDYLPVGLNWGYMTLVQAAMAGARVVLMERFSADGALELIEKERVTYIPTAPASIPTTTPTPKFKCGPI